MQWLLSLKLVVLLTVANGVPAIAWRVFGEYFNEPLDGGSTFIDQQPIFGDSKTIRGIVLSLVATTAAAPVLGIEWVIGLCIGGVAMLGDLGSSFLKRRFNMPPSSRATVSGATLQFVSSLPRYRSDNGQTRRSYRPALPQRFTEPAIRCEDPARGLRSFTNLFC
jgi:hypothetical protein